MRRFFDNKYSIQIKNRYIYIILFLIIASTLGRFIFIFVNNKEGHHSDESWSYGFANSYYDPYDFWDINGDVFLNNSTDKNVNEWVSGSYYKDYIVVNESERFTYDSVIYNKLGDNSPSLYEIFLHTVCSFFPGIFSWWFGFSINILCYIFIEIFLYNVALNISNNKFFALLMPLYYGLSRAALNTILYIRMYALLTLITLILFYMVQRLVRKEYKSCTFEQLIIILLLFLGGFTHFYYMVFAFFFAVIFSLFLIIKKKWRNLLTFAGTFLLGAIAYVGIYPYGIRRMLSGSDMYENSLRWPYHIELMKELDYIFKDLFGIPYFFDRFWLLDTAVISIILCVIWGILHFIFRNDVWMKSIISKEKKCITNLKNKTLLNRFYQWLIHHNELTFIIFLASLLTVFIVTKFSDITSMGVYSDRYVMFLFPLVELSVIYLIYNAVRFRITKLTIKSNVTKSNLESGAVKKKIILIKQYAYSTFFFALLVFFLCMCMTGKQYYYFESNADGFVLDEYLENKNVIIINKDTWTQEWYCTEIYKAANVFFTDYNYTDETIEKIASLNSDKDYVIIVTSSVTGISNDDSSAVADESYSNSGSNEDFINKLSLALELNPEYILTMDSFCGKLEIYNLNGN